MSSASRLATVCVLMLLVACAQDGQTASEEVADDGGATASATAGATAGDTETAEDCAAATARASHHISGESAAHRGLEVLAEEAATRTDGRVTVEIFSDAQLGGLAEMTENLRSGAVEIALIDSGSLSQFEAEFGVFDLPFLFTDMGQFNDLMDGAIGEEINERVQTEVNVAPLYWSAVGLRNMFFVDATVETPDDLAGLTMRVPEAPVWIDTFRALGTSPTAIPSGELYTALQTGVVDGFEFPLGTAVDLKMYEPVSTMSRTGHILTNILIAASPQFMDSLCEADRAALVEAAGVAEGRTRALWQEDNEAADEILVEELTVVDEPDIPAFREAVEPVHTAFVEANGSALYDRIRSEIGS
jgi:tripartite ATP-independent transporter DctP family solute receptor